MGARAVPPTAQAPRANVRSRWAPASISNVSPVTSVIDLITANRAFDLYTKTSTTIDQMNQTAISQVGRKQG